MNDQIIYLDYAAATPIDPQVLQLMQPYFSDDFFNPSASYTQAIKIKRAVDEARAKVAYWLGAKPNEIIFTAGATEANNLAIHGIMSAYPKGNIVVSNIEHESILALAGQYDCRVAKVLPDGRLDLNDLRHQIDRRTVLVSVMQANNEIGVIQPIHDIAQIVKRERAQRSAEWPIYLHTDASQAANYLDLHVARLGADLMSLNGGKIYGPKQSGVLFIKTGINLKPLVWGGGQERNLRSGTESVSNIIGLAYALDTAQAMRQEESQRLQLLSQHFMNRLAEVLPDATINGSLKYRLPNNVHVTLPGQDNERLLIQLNRLGILAAAGSACSASNEEPSHVLKAIGQADEAARSSIRFSLGRGTTEKDLDKVVDSLSKLIKNFA